MNRWKISQSINGWIIYEDMSDTGYIGKSWVAETNEKLGELIVRLANNEEPSECAQTYVGKPNDN